LRYFRLLPQKRYRIDTRRELRQLNRGKQMTTHSGFCIRSVAVWLPTKALLRRPMFVTQRNLSRHGECRHISFDLHLILQR